ncbi:CHASE domain-containing protein [Novosphingobium umbonatum]|nr:CHASE domain-containing protein [Novosphingobium umbonatum]
MDRIVAQRVETQKWYERMPRSVPIGVFALAMLMTLLFVAALEQAERHRQQTQVKAVTTVVASALERRVATHMAYLRAAALLMEKRQQVTLADFTKLGEEFNNDQEYRGSESISWSPVLRYQDVPAFEAARHAEGMTGYRIYPKPRPEEPLIAPITYLGSPTPRRRLALGFNYFSEPVRRAAMERAWKEKRPTATTRIRLMMDRDQAIWPGFLIYMPVFDPATQALRGFLSAPFNARTFLESALELEPVHGYAISLYDGPEQSDHLLARAGPSGEVVSTSRTKIEVASRPMLLVVAAPQVTGLSRVGAIALTMGTLVSGLLGAVAWMVARQAMEDRAALTWLREQASIRGTMSRELNHRVKNTLANVLSIIALTSRRATSLPEFVQGLEGRIRALSATHDLLMANDWGATALRAIVEAELAPYAQKGGGVTMYGPDVELAPNDALSLGLAVHELATNASKYGALSQEGGRVSVVWALQDEGKVRVDWRESGGPEVPSERPRGFGTELIERIVAYELGEAVELKFEPKGVHCSLVLPLRIPAKFMIRAPKPAKRKGWSGSKSE